MHNRISGTDGGHMKGRIAALPAGIDAPNQWNRDRNAIGPLKRVDPAVDRPATIGIDPNGQRTRF
jgi:hypothetical protein